MLAETPLATDHDVREREREDLLFRIGHIAIEHPFTQAALSGYSDLPMRLIARRHGASYAVNEVVLDKSVLRNSSWRCRTLALDPEDHPVGGQLMGADPDQFGPAARILADAGYDIIDINFGCPAKKVLRRCRGGFLLSEPATATVIIKNVIDAVGKDAPVTVKMRRGIDHSQKSRRDFFTIIDRAFELGVAAVTIHGRSVEQRYVGPSDWRFVRQVKEHVGDRVILGSGDLFTAGDCVRMLEETGVDGVTVARGSIGNPWVFDQCRALFAGRPLPHPPSIAEQRRTMAMHLKLVLDHYGPKLAGKIMFKFAMSYCKLHPEPRRTRDACLNARCVDRFRELLDRW